MRTEGSKVYFSNKHEKELYTDLVDHIVDHYTKKPDARRLINNIQWYMDKKKGTWFAGFLYDVSGWISCWGIYEGGQDKEKYNLYADFMGSEYADLALTAKPPARGSLVPYAIVTAYSLIMHICEDKGLVEIKA